MLTTDEVIQPGKYKLVIEGTEPPPPTSDCECDVKAGNTSTLAPGSQATVQSRKVDKTTFFDFGIPQGMQGIPGPPGTGSGGGSLKSLFDVTAFGAKGDGSNDDTQAFQNAINAAGSGLGQLYIPAAPNFWKITNTLNVIPTNGQQIWLDVISYGRAGAIKYSGPSNQPVFRVHGLKGASWQGLYIEITNGRNNCQCVHIDTPPDKPSSSFNTFSDFYLNLGDGQNNVGIKTGGNAHHGDISNYNFENIVCFGGGKAGTPNVAIPGQYAFQNLGMNTLSMSWWGGFVAFCDRAYSNISSDGQSRGNGATFFNDLGCSQNNEDFVFAFEQTYKISGGRFEASNRFMRLTANGATAHVTIESATVHDHRGVNGNLIQIDGQGTVSIIGSMFANTPGNKYASPINISPGKWGALSVRNCSFTSDKIVTASGNVDVELRGNIKLGSGFQSIGLFANQ